MRTYIEKEFEIVDPERRAEIGEIISPVFMYEPLYVWHAYPDIRYFTSPESDPFVPEHPQDDNSEVSGISLLTGKLMTYHTCYYVILRNDEILRKRFERLFRRRGSNWLRMFNEREAIYQEWLRTIKEE
ncbi:MAG: hypothetical protein NC311_06425 [Muribaculaceae bacterium]|nr:hypothetical protein [Muribaculaceae bacterium]